MLFFFHSKKKMPDCSLNLYKMGSKVFQFGHVLRVKQDRIPRHGHQLRNANMAGQKLTWWQTVMTKLKEMGSCGVRRWPLQWTDPSGRNWLLPVPTSLFFCYCNELCNIAPLSFHLSCFPLPQKCQFSPEVFVAWMAVHSTCSRLDVSTRYCRY